MLFISSKTSSSQRFLGFPNGLIDISFHLLIFCTLLSSAMRSTWPNQHYMLVCINHCISIRSKYRKLIFPAKLAFISYKFSWMFYFHVCVYVCVCVCVYYVTQVISFAIDYFKIQLHLHTISSPKCDVTDTLTRTEWTAIFIVNSVMQFV